MVALILSKDDFTPAEVERILHYCTEDVRLTEQLLLKMLPRLRSVPRTLARAIRLAGGGNPAQRRAAGRAPPAAARRALVDIQRIAIRELDQLRHLPGHVIQRRPISRRR